ncbi:aldo/keto reductase [Oscillospiraceae bacterium MB08-C2-2]|nr:aldo/keto reductase [Oscillospiraceae bacterium MB08-C2-2]
MVTNKMDKLGVTTSRLGFGCMRFPILPDGKIDRPKAQGMLDYAYDHGVNYYDTAYVYHNQESESFLGEALAKYPRESFYLATKLPVWLCETREDADRIFHEQLNRCKTEYFDFYLLHSLDGERWPHCEEHKFYDYLLEQKAQGKIRHLGFSFHGAYEDFVTIVDAHPWDFVQIQINYMDEEVQDARAFYDKLLEKDIPCLAMEPIRGGFLSRLSEDVAQVFTDYDPSMSQAQWALRWCLSQKNIKVILSGMSTLEQVQENVATFTPGDTLNEEQLECITLVREKILAVKAVPCTGCRYCMDCGFGVDIPGVFDAYNQYMMFKNSIQGYNQYSALGSGQGSACVACGVCSPQCPQGIDIPATIEKAHAKLSVL